MKKEIWIKAFGHDTQKNKSNFIAGLEAGADSVIAEDEGMHKMGRFANILMKDDIREFDIAGPSDLSELYDHLETPGHVIVRFSDWDIIPSENLIAHSGVARILVEVDNEKDARVHLNVLEKGVDGLLIDSDDPEVVRNILKIFSKNPNIELVEAVAKEVRNIDLGDRVCVDTCTIMEPGEGMLVGSRSSFMFLIGAETEENGYIEPRPFRVNAGAVHSYILLPDGKTAYLSELRAGSIVYVFDRKGNARRTNVGRSKIEKRPLILIEFEYKGIRGSVILQNAETVRFITPDGSVPVTSVKAGDTVLAYVEDGGRHCGNAIDETIREI